MRTRLRGLPVLRRWLAEDIEPPTTWSGPAEGRRVLIEEDDAELRAAMAKALQDAGFRTAECAGPGTHGDRRCPLVAGQGCDAVDRADAVLEVFVPTDEDMHRVRQAIRDHDPGKPIAVLSPASAARRHAHLLAGTTVSTEALTGRAVVAAAEDAVGRGPSTRHDEDPASAGGGS